MRLALSTCISLIFILVVSLWTAESFAAPKHKGYVSQQAKKKKHSKKAKRRLTKKSVKKKHKSKISHKPVMEPTSSPMALPDPVVEQD